MWISALNGSIEYLCIIIYFTRSFSAEHEILTEMLAWHRRCVTRREQRLRKMLIHFSIDSAPRIMMRMKPALNYYQIQGDHTYVASTANSQHWFMTPFLSELQALVYDSLPQQTPSTGLWQPSSANSQHWFMTAFFSKLQALVYDSLPPATAMTGYAIGQCFVGAQMAEVSK